MSLSIVMPPNLRPQSFNLNFLSYSSLIYKISLNTIPSLHSLNVVATLSEFLLTRVIKTSDNMIFIDQIISSLPVLKFPRETEQ